MGEAFTFLAGSDSVLGGHFSVYAFLLAMVVAGVYDVLERRIPNILVIGMLIGFAPLAIVGGMAGSVLLAHALGALTLLLVGYGLFSLGFIGGGDAKLMAAAGLWLGPLPSVFFVLLSALCGGVLAATIGLVYLARVEIGMMSRKADRMLSQVIPNVPYGFAFAAGAILATPYSWMALAAAGNHS